MIENHWQLQDAKNKILAVLLKLHKRKALKL